MKLVQEGAVSKVSRSANENSIFCVGGRLQNSSLDLELIHPIILPKTGSTFTMIARDCHNTIAHGGRSATMHEIRRAGY